MTITRSVIHLNAFALSSLVLLFAASPCRAQQPEVQSNTAPPPLKVISSQDRNLLNQAKDNKARVKKTIELAEAHLLKAEGHTVQEEYTAASSELGQYGALMENVLAHLAGLKSDSNKTRDMYKRVELALRAHGIRLTLIRRTTPIEYAVWIKQLEEFTRNGRTEALNSFYGHTVVRDPQKSKQAPAGKTAVDSVPPERQ
jgi:hypothetical protein